MILSNNWPLTLAIVSICTITTQFMLQYLLHNICLHLLRCTVYTCSCVACTVIYCIQYRPHAALHSRAVHTRVWAVTHASKVSNTRDTIGNTLEYEWWYSRVRANNCEDKWWHLWVASYPEYYYRVWKPDTRASCSSAQHT